MGKTIVLFFEYFNLIIYMVLTIKCGCVKEILIYWYLINFDLWKNFPNFFFILDFKDSEKNGWFIYNQFKPQRAVLNTSGFVYGVCCAPLFNGIYVVTNSLVKVTQKESKGNI